MRFWNGECSRAFTDWRGSFVGVDFGAWTIAHIVMADPVEDKSTL